MSTTSQTRYFSPGAESLCSDFRIVERIAYLGFNRGKTIAGFDTLFGVGNWTLAFLYRGRLISYQAALELYEESYFRFLRDQTELTDWMVKEGRDVYDSAESNVESGTDYGHQETPNTHLQDIAVRRSLRRLGRWFGGTKLLRIRGHDSELYALNPGRVPFCDVEAILQPRVAELEWALPGSIEEFWQNNKVLVVRTDQATVERLRGRLQSMLSNKQTAGSKLLLRAGQTLDLLGAMGDDEREAFEASLEKHRRDAEAQEVRQRVGYLRSLLATMRVGPT